MCCNLHLKLATKSGFPTINHAIYLYLLLRGREEINFKLDFLEYVFSQKYANLSFFLSNLSGMRLNE